MKCAIVSPSSPPLPLANSGSNLWTSHGTLFKTLTQNRENVTWATRSRISGLNFGNIASPAHLVEWHFLLILKRIPEFGDIVKQYLGYDESVKDTEKGHLNQWTELMGQTRLDRVPMAAVSAFVAKRQGLEKSDEQ